MKWKFWQKDVPCDRSAEWLDGQLAWMKKTLEFLEQEFPKDHQRIVGHLNLMLIGANTETPAKVTRYICEELEEIRDRES